MLKMRHLSDGCGVVGFPNFENNAPGFTRQDCYNSLETMANSVEPSKQHGARQLGYFLLTFVRIEAVFALSLGVTGLYSIVALPFQYRFMAHGLFFIATTGLVLVDGNQGAGLKFGVSATKLIGEEKDADLIPFLILWLLLSFWHAVCFWISREECGRLEKIANAAIRFQQSELRNKREQ